MKIKFLKWLNGLFKSKIENTSIDSHIIMEELQEEKLEKNYADEMIVEDNNGDINFLIMDDNSGTIHFIKNDIDSFRKMNKVYNHDKNYRDMFLEELEKMGLLECFGKIDFDRIRVFEATSSMAGFIVNDYINQNHIKFHFAMLDIILGGVNYDLINQRIISFDGIDIAKKLKENNKDIIFKFYSGCAIDKHSDENLKYKELFNGEDIYQNVIIKDTKIINRKLQLFLLIKEYFEKEGLC